MLALSPVSPTLAWAASSSVDKAETVHVELDTMGEVSRVRVEDLLSNPAQKPQLKDRSDLDDIKPQSDDQSFTKSSDGTITWSADGEEVSYEGTSTKKPPVRVKVSYTLDGKKVQPSDLAGATGHLVMRFDYENTSSRPGTIRGKQQRIYTPFVCMTAALLDGKVFSNVTVTNGKVIEDKGGLAVVGFATPGLRESLDTGAENTKLDLPEYLQIEADVTDLALDPIYTIVTPELLDELDTSDLGFDELDDFGEGADELEDAMGQLIDGASTLEDALQQLADGGTQLGKGAAALKEALGGLPKGTAALAEGAHGLADGLDTATEVADQLAEGTEGLPTLVTTSEEALDATSKAVDGASSAVKEAQQSVTALQQGLSDFGLEEAKTAAADTYSAAEQVQSTAQEARDALAATAPVVTVPPEISTGLQGAQDALAALEALDTTNLSEEQLAALEQAKSSLAAVTSAQEALSGITASIDSVSLDTLDTAIQTLSTSNATLQATKIDASTVSESAQTAATSLQTAADALTGTSEGFSTAADLLDALDKATGGVSAGISGLATSLGDATDGASTLAKQLDGLATQAPQLLSGVDALSTGASQLAQGLSATAQGSGALTQGLSTFNDEGISKVVNAFDELDEDLGSTSDRLDALRDAARAYNSFSGKADGATSSVRFIYKTAQIG